MAEAESFSSLLESGAQDAIAAHDTSNGLEFAKGPSPFGDDQGIDLGNGIGAVSSAQSVCSPVDDRNACPEEVFPRASSAVDTAVSISDYNRLLFEARLEGVGDAELKLPWETGVMKEIFAEDDSATGELFRFPFEYLGVGVATQSAANSSSSTEIAKSSVQTKLEMPHYFFAVKVKPDLDIHALTDALWNKSVGKWLQVFEILGFPGQLGTALEYESLYADLEQQGTVLRDALGIKSPRTAIKRAQTLLQYFRWAQGAFSDWDPWNRTRCLTYLGCAGDFKVAASRGLSLLEALRFARFVMQIPIPETLLMDAQIKGRAQRLMLNKREYKPARSLKASEVVAMEQGMVSDMDPLDKYLLGAALFCLYSRSRWSDIQHLDSVWLDRNEHNGEIFGFVETCTVYHKTATSLRKKRIFLPIVCPILGVTNIDWTSEWFAVWRALGINMDSTPFGALCKAPNSEGGLCRRSCTSEEIGAFVNRFLRTSGDNSISSHSLKHTTLEWCSSYGMEEPLRTLLGHHELPGSKSMAVYSRDMLTRPLQA